MSMYGKTPGIHTIWQTFREMGSNGKGKRSLNEYGLRRRGEDFPGRGWDAPGRNFYPYTLSDRHAGCFKRGFLEVCLPVKGLGNVFIVICIVVVTKGLLLTIFHFYDPFHGCFRRIIIFIIGVGIIITVVPKCLAAYAEVQELQGDQGDQDLPGYVEDLFLHPEIAKLFKITSVRTNYS